MATNNDLSTIITILTIFVLKKKSRNQPSLTKKSGLILWLVFIMQCLIIVRLFAERILMLCLGL